VHVVSYRGRSRMHANYTSAAQVMHGTITVHSPS
jgi:hypothetical protein